jgi:ribosomal protein L3
VTTTNSLAWFGWVAVSPLQLQRANTAARATGNTVDAERNLLLIRGAVPGAKTGDVIIRAASKG